MKQRPILFNGEMVRAILSGQKTQTRRIVKMPPSWDCFVVADWGGGWRPYKSDDGENPSFDNNEIELNCPYGQVGDQLWVRETWQHSNFPLGPFEDDCEIFYRADYLDDIHGPDGEKSSEGKYRFWKPSIHMPRAASRTTLEITSVRVEQLQEISVKDAIAEGIPRRGPENPDGIEQREYRELWESINGPDSWDANPWVWVIEFKKLEQAPTEKVK